MLYCWSFEIQNNTRKYFYSGLFTTGLEAIQQLRGQEDGEGGQPKVHACPPRGGGPLNIHVDQNLAFSESISYHCAL